MSNSKEHYRITKKIDNLHELVSSAMIEIESLNRMRRKDVKLRQILSEAGVVAGGHHKAWYIDQIAREILDDGYDDFIALIPGWDDGIAP